VTTERVETGRPLGAIRLELVTGLGQRAMQRREAIAQKPIEVDGRVDRGAGQVSGSTVVSRYMTRCGIRPR
jgi:hypothetical protein